MDARYLISLSGGGYRASLFHAGVLRVLHDSGVLVVNLEFDRDFVFVNAVSGGSIPACIWNRFLRSQEYADNPSSMLPEEVLIDLIENSPRRLGRFNWHLRGGLFWRQTVWFHYFERWWENLRITEKPPGPAGSYESFVKPGLSQTHPVFLLEMLDFNDGRILTYHEGRIFAADEEFFKKGDPGNLVANKVSTPKAVVAATAFPVFFPKVSVNRSKLMDAGLVDNQAIFGFQPLLTGMSQDRNLLNSSDQWFLSNAGRAMNVPTEGTPDPFGINPKVKKLTRWDRIFRLTGDLAQIRD